MQYGIKPTSSILDTDSLNLFLSDQSSYLLKYDVKTATTSALDTGYFRHIVPSPDKTHLLLVKRKGSVKLGEIDLLNKPWNFHHELGIVNLTTNRKFFIPKETFDATASIEEKPYVWGNDNKVVYVRSINNKTVAYVDVRNTRFYNLPTPYEYDLSVAKNRTSLLAKDGEYTFDSRTGRMKKISSRLTTEQHQDKFAYEGNVLDTSPDGQSVLSSKTDSLGVHLQLESKNISKTIRSFNTWLSQVVDVKRRLVEFIDGYGNYQKALLLYPAFGKEAAQVIVSCYPGQTIKSLHHSGVYETKIDSDSFLNLMIFASNGFHVLIPTMKTEGQDDYFEFHKSVIPAVNATQKLFNSKQVDFHLLGLSYGGYSVYSLVTQTTRFKSAIVLSGFGDLTSAYGNFDIRYRYTDNPFENVQRLRNPETGQGALGVPYFRNPAKYIRNSPIFYSDKIQTPVLIFHGDRDFVSIEQAEEMFTMLYRQGKKCRFVRLWGEGHNINSPKNIELMWREILAWLN